MYVDEVKHSEYCCIMYLHHEFLYFCVMVHIFSAHGRLNCSGKVCRISELTSYYE